MIVLKILLFILLAVLGLILLVLIMPVGGEVSFIGGKLKYKVSLWIINVMDSDGGGILGWLKKRKSKKKPKKPKKTKKRRSGKKRKKKKAESGIPPETTAGNNADEFSSQDVCEAASAENKSVPLSVEKTAAEISVSETEDDISGSDDDTDHNVYEIPEDEPGAEKSRKKGKKKKKNKDSDDGKTSLSDKLDKLVDIWGSAKNPLCLIFKAFKFSDLYIDFVIANEDAYKCALNYGRLSAVTYRGIALMSRIFTVRLKTVDIQPGFGLKKGRFDAAFRLRFRAGTFVIAGLWFLITYIFRVFIPGKLRSRKDRKSAAAQK